MKVLTGATKQAFLVFFISHIPITLLIDAQAVFSLYYPEALRSLVRWYCDDMFGDVLMRYPDSPIWFQALVGSEVTCQLPFFFLAVHVIGSHPKANTAAPTKSRGSLTEEHYPSWFQTISLIYGAHVVTTMIPILTTFWTSDQMTPLQILATTAIYAPYLLFPLALLWLAAADDLYLFWKYLQAEPKRVKSV